MQSLALLLTIKSCQVFLSQEGDEEIEAILLASLRFLLVVIPQIPLESTSSQVGRCLVALDPHPQLTLEMISSEGLQKQASPFIGGILQNPDGLSWIPLIYEKLRARHKGLNWKDEHLAVVIRQIVLQLCDISLFLRGEFLP